MRNIFILFTLLLMVNCSDMEKLGNDYYYLPDYESLDIGYPYGSLVYKSEQQNHFDSIIIFSDIKAVNYDNSYIIVSQMPNRNLILKNVKDNLNTWNDFYAENNKDSLVELCHKKIKLKEIHHLINKSDSLRINQIADSIFNDNLYYKKIFKNKYNYYIIQKNKDSVFGPLTLTEFRVLKSKKKMALDFL